jgi:hypothetical protein
MSVPLPQGAKLLTGEDLQLPPGALDISSLDTKTGAPKDLRVTVSAYKKPEDKLKLIRKYYPEAIPWSEGNYIFTNPSTGQPTLFNPGGFDFGDVLEYGRIVPEIIGAIGGGIIGGLGTTPTVAGIPVGVAGGAAVGSQFLGESYDAMLRYFFGKGQEDTRSAAEQLSDIALAGTIEAVTPFPVAGGAQYLRNSLNKVLNDPAAKSTYESASNLGIKSLPFGVTTKDQGIARIENGLATTMGGRPIVKSYQDGLFQLNNAIDNLTLNGQELSKLSAGDLIIDGVNKYTDDFFNRSDFMYTRLGKSIPQNITFDMPSTKALLKANQYRFSNKQLSELFGSNFSDQLNLYFKGDPKLTYLDLKQLRTSVGKQLKGTYVVGTSPDATDMKKLYGALSDDLFNAANSMGGDIGNLAVRANDFYKNGLNFIEKDLTPLFTTGRGKDFLSSEKIYDNFMNKSKTETSRINNVFGKIFTKNLGTEENLKLIGEKQFKDLSLNPKGDFSPSYLVTNLNKYKTATGEYPLTIQSLGDKVFDIENVAKGFDKASQSVNFSNTAFGNATREFYTALGFGGTTGVLTGDFIPGLAAAGAAYVTPRVITTALSNPVTRAAFRNWALKPDLPISEKVAVLTSVGFTGPMAQSLIEGSYKQQGLLDLEE